MVLSEQDYQSKYTKFEFLDRSEQEDDSHLLRCPVPHGPIWQLL